MIYYLSEFSNIGGIENYGRDFIKQFYQQYKYVKFKILCSSENCIFEDEFTQMGIEIVYLPNFKKHPLKFYIMVKTIFSSFNNNDLLHYNLCSFRNVLLFHAIKKTNIKSILVGHFNKPIGRLKLLHSFSKNHYKNLSINVAVSESNRYSLFSRKADVKIIENGIPDSFSYSLKGRNRIRRKYGISKDTILIGHVGRLSSEKNQQFSLSFLEAIVKTKKIKLLFLGTGDREDIVNEVKKRNLGDKVIFDYCSPSVVQDYYSAFDYVVIPSIQESFSLALIEAVACGAKIIVSFGVPDLKILYNGVKRVGFDILEWEKAFDTLEQTEINRNSSLLPDSFRLSNTCKQYYNLYKKTLEI